MRQNLYKYADTPWQELSPGCRRQILGNDNQIMMVRIDFQEGASAPEHTHFHAQTTFIVSGRFEFTVSGERMVVGPGDSFYFEPNNRHGLRCLESGTVIDCFSPTREDFIPGK